MSILHELVKSGNDFERVRQLIHRGESANDKDNEGNTPLHIVASKPSLNPQDTEDSVRMARVLLECGAEISMKNKDGDTPLHAVASEKRTNPHDIEYSVRMARVLIESGAEINETNEEDFTPLSFAVMYENLRLVEFLLNKTADVDIPNRFSFRALHLAIKYPINLSDNPDWDEYYATRKTVLDMVKTILNFNPDINARNGRNETAVLMAAKYQDLPVLKELLNRGASVHYFDNSEKSPMSYAVDRPSINLDIVMELLRHRAPFDIPKNYGLTPMDFFLKWLEKAEVAEVKRAKYVFRGFVLETKPLERNHEIKIRELSELKGVELALFIERYKNEKDKMEQDVLAEGCSVLNMARRGFFFATEMQKDKFSDVFDALQHKLMKSEYPLYRDIIVCSLSRKHLSKKIC